MKVSQVVIARQLSILGLTILFTYIYWLLYQMPAIGIDDANIYFVYIRNLAEGHGMVYNTGGEKVEGFTSMFWVLLGVPLYLLHPQHYPFLLLALNTVIVAITLANVAKFIQTLNGRSEQVFSISTLLLLLYVFIVPGFVEWNILALMETGLWCFLLTNCVLQLCYYAYGSKSKHVVNLGVLIFLLVLTRPESMAWGLFFIFLFVFISFLKHAERSFRKAGVLFATFGLTLVLLVAFRFYYFGYPLPNTYYAKVSADKLDNLFSGLHYTLYSIWQSPMLWVFVAAALVSLLLFAVRIKQIAANRELLDLPLTIQLVAALTTLLSFMIPVYVGGDHFAFHRHYQPFIPVYFILLANIPFWKKYLVLQVSLATPFNSSRVWLLGLLPLLYFTPKDSLHQLRERRSPMAAEFTIAELSRSEAEQLNKLFSHADKLPAVGVSAAGGFAYSYKGTTIDLMGLNNTVMAHASDLKKGTKNHAAFDIDTFLKQAPEVFHGYSHGNLVLAAFHSDTTTVRLDENDPEFAKSFVYRMFKGLFERKDFRELYQPAVIGHPKAENLYYQAYFRSDYLDQIAAQGYWIKPLKRVGSPEDVIRLVLEDASGTPTTH